MTRPDRNDVDYRFGLNLMILLIGFEYVRPQITLLPALQVMRLGMVLQILMFIYVLFKRPVRMPKIGYGLCIFLAVLAFTVPFADNRFFAYGVTQYMFKLFITSMFPIIFYLRTFESYERFKKYFVAINVFVALWALTHGGKGTGHFLGDENDLATAMGVILPFTYFSIFSSRSQGEKFIWILLSLIVLGAIVASRSRGGFLGLLGCLAYILVHTPRRGQVVKALVVMAAVAAVSVPKSYWDEMGTIAEGREDKTADERLYSWKLGWRMFLDDPVFGSGADNYPMVAHSYGDMGGEDKGRRHLFRRAAHSLYFTLLPELGLVGLLAYLYLLRLFFKNTRPILEEFRQVILTSKGTTEWSDEQHRQVKLYYHGLSLRAAMISFLCNGVFISVLYYPHYWTLLALSSALVVVSQEEKRKALEPEHRAEPEPQLTA